jgi:hypothetical protein
LGLGLPAGPLKLAARTTAEPLLGYDREIITLEFFLFKWFLDQSLRACLDYTIDCLSIEKANLDRVLRQFSACFEQSFLENETVLAVSERWRVFP